VDRDWSAGLAAAGATILAAVALGIAMQPRPVQEVDKILSASPYPWHAFWMLGLCCGVRRGEAVAWRWQDIDLEKRILPRSPQFRTRQAQTQ
jgi:integrase